MPQNNVLEVVSALSRSFNSIDLRIAAIKQTEWTSIISSITFSHLPPSEIRAKHRRISRRLSKVLNDSFHFFLLYYPFSEWHNIVDALKNGKISSRSGSIIVNPIDPLQLRVHSYSPDFLKRDDEWKLLGAIKDPQNMDDTFWSAIDSYAGQAKLLGYDGVYELINEILRVQTFSRGNARSLVLNIPVYSKITKVSIAGNLIKVTTRFYSRLDGLQLNLSAQRTNVSGFYQTFERHIKTIKNKSPENDCFVEAQTQVRFSDVKSYDNIRAILIHKSIPEISIDEQYKLAPLKNPTEPLAKTLAQFCSMEVFKERLLNPEKCKEKKLKPDQIFENAITWLLSLYGYSVVHLHGQHQELIIPTTGYHLGSLDIIAYKPDRLLLIDCDTSMPDHKKIGALMNIKNSLSESPHEREPLILVPMIFTPRDIRGTSIDKQGVAIVEKFGIERLFNESMKGNLDALDAIYPAVADQ